MKMRWIMLFSLTLESRLKEIKDDLSRRDLPKCVDSFMALDGNILETFILVSCLLKLCPRP